MMRIGTKVYVHWADGGFYAYTRSIPFLNHGERCVFLAGHSGYWLLDKLTVENDSHQP
jgi:hypothetical protein